MAYETVEDLKENIEKSVRASVLMESLLPKEIAELRGMSSPRIRHFLNTVCSFGPCKYLEIGVWAGSTLIPAMYKNQVEAVAIDNWSQFTADQLADGFNAREALNMLLLRYGAEFKRYELVNADCFSQEAYVKGNEPFNVFFYDGNHDAPSTQSAIMTYGTFCHKPFILIVDDIELTPSVRFGMEEALKQFKVHKSWHLEKKDGYHEGIWIGIIE